MGLLDKAEKLRTLEEEKPSLLKKAEKFASEPESLAQDPIDSEEDWVSPESELPPEEIPEDLPPADAVEEIDVFDNWEKEAKVQAEETPLQPVSEDSVPEKQEFLFDDDSDYATAPMEQYLASKKRIENYRAIFEITKEISSSKDFSEFFENLAYSIMGQVGCSSVVIFTSTVGVNHKWEAVESHGLELNADWVFYPTDDVYQRIQESDTVVYSKELLSAHLPPREKSVLGDLASEILVPIQHKEECFGFFALGKLIHGEDYLVDDLEFTKIIGEIAGSVFKRVSEFEKTNEELETAKQLNEINSSIIQFAKQFANVRTMDEAYDTFIEQIKEKLGVKQFTFLVLDSESRLDYIVFGSNFLLPERTKTFKLGKDSDLVGMISNVSGVYKLENFREDPELKSIFTNDELGIMSEFTLLPVINLNWLVGVLLVHGTSKSWTDTVRDTAVTMLETAAPTLANLLILSEKEALYRNPFNPLESRILQEIEKAKEFKTSFTVTMFKVQNVARIVHILGASQFARYTDNLRKSIVDHSSEDDFFTRVGQGKFALVLHGKDKEETEIVVKKIKAAFAKREEGNVSSFRPTYRILSLSYPKDTKDKNQFMELIEEA